MSDFLDQDQLPQIPNDERAARACLGCLCAGPQDVPDGDWVLLLKDGEGRPLAVSHVGLVFDSTAPPLVAASSALSRAGYDHEPTATNKPWAAEWTIIRP